MRDFANLFISTEDFVARLPKYAYFARHRIMPIIANEGPVQALGPPCDCPEVSLGTGTRSSGDDLSGDVAKAEGWS